MKQTSILFLFLSIFACAIPKYSPGELTPGISIQNQGVVARQLHQHGIDYYQIAHEELLPVLLTLRQDIFNDNTRDVGSLVSWDNADPAYINYLSNTVHTVHALKERAVWRVSMESTKNPLIFLLEWTEVDHPYVVLAHCYLRQEGGKYRIVHDRTLEESFFETHNHAN